jgi:2-polyprenyl-3-methyl-5-hydroxy-6-metoxy-1,4-benzoquinol methylase
VSLWETERVDAYWNHNAAYHAMIVNAAARRPARVLDVGCGEGLLVERLARIGAHVTGVDPDEVSVARARERTATLGNVTLRVAEFLEMPAERASYDLVTFVATLHHMNLERALRRARELLVPGGELFVVGVAARKTPADWVISGLQIPLVRVLNRVHHEARNVGVVVAEPREGLREIRAAAKRELPGVRVRRGLYYRYLLRWRKSAEGPDTR